MGQRNPLLTGAMGLPKIRTGIPSIRRTRMPHPPGHWLQVDIFHVSMRGPYASFSTHLSGMAQTWEIPPAATPVIPSICRKLRRVIFMFCSPVLSVTSRAIGVHAVLGVAIDAKRHLDGTIRFGKRGRHFGHVPVAREAGDFSDRHMPPVGKIRVIGHPVNLYPWDGLVFPDIIHHLFLFFALRHRLFMTAFADSDVRDRGLFVGTRTGVAVEAVQAGVFNVFFVVIQNRLWMIYAF